MAKKRKTATAKAKSGGNQTSQICVETERRITRDWNNHDLWHIMGKVEKLVNEDQIRRALAKSDTGYVRSIAECVHGLLHDLADYIDDVDAAVEEGRIKRED